ncbi:MAG TPA: S8 family serine peptidase [Phycisphaerae bacterium]|nr:S8 family serine peptidase [Phycisphaerae bacterium]
MTLVLLTAGVSAAADLPARHIYFDGKPIALEPDSQRIAVRFAPGVSAGQKQALLTAEARVAVGPVQESLDRPSLDIFALNRATGRTLLPRARALAKSADIALATPVYRAMGIDVIPTGEVFVQFTAGAGEAGVQEAMRDFALTLVAKTSWRADNYLLRVTPASPSDALDVAEQLLQRSDVVYSQPNLLRRLEPQDEPNDPLFSQQWGLHNIGQAPGGIKDPDLDAPEAWCITHGCDVTIAIIDEGCDLTHPDLIGKYAAGLGYDAVDGDNVPEPMPWDAHGTACAGIAAAETHNNAGVAGVNWEARIMPIRIAYSPSPGANWVTTDQWIADSIAYAWTHGADVLSNSWGGGPPSDQIHAAIRDATLQGRGGLGAIVVFAAGNDNQPQASYPGRHPETICVAATSPCDERKSPTSCDGENWWGSNYGDGVDVAAPGVKIATTDIAGSAGYCPDPGGHFVCTNGNAYVKNFNGTSAATPFVAGVASMVICQYPSYTEKEIRARLEQTCDKVGGYSYSAVTGRSFDLGYGRVNLYRALSGKPQVVGGPGHNNPSIYSDAGDAPLPYGTPATVHESAACEWLGEEFSPEVNRSDPKDPDGKINLDNQDAFDDGVTFFPPYIPSQPGQVAVTVSVENWQALRYQTQVPTLYVNVWFDWQSDGDWNNTYDWAVQNEPVTPSSFGGNGQSFVYNFIVPDLPVGWHLQSGAPGQFLNVRTRLSCAPLTDAYSPTDCGEVEDDQFLNFVEMFLQDQGYMTVFSYGCDPWSWLSGFEPWTCHPPFYGNPPTGYMTAEVYNPAYYGDYHSGLQTPSFDLSELTEAYLEYDFSAVEPVTGFVNIYTNGVLAATPRVYAQSPLALCGLLHDIVDLTPYCKEGNTDVFIEFKTYPPDPCPITPLPDYQDWKLDNIVVWGRDAIAPALTRVTVTPQSTEIADLQWTAPGDDVRRNHAELYNVRYGPQPITAANWRHALWLAYAMTGGNLPVPQGPGALESLTVAGLSPGLHYFSVRTLDEVNNISAVGPGGQNRAPTLTGPATVTATAGDLVTFDVTGTDPDFDPLALTASPPDPAAAFADNYNNTGTFTWQTDAFDLGTHLVPFAAEDPNGLTTSHTVTIDVQRSGRDQNHNGVDDTDDIIGGTSLDCQPNGYPDEVDIATGAEADCQSDQIPDSCQLAGNDCNANAVPDGCDPKGDFDVDGDVDRADAQRFIACQTTVCPTASCMPTLYSGSCCRFADFDDDGDVDLQDAQQFQAVYTGP